MSLTERSIISLNCSLEMQLRGLCRKVLGAGSFEAEQNLFEVGLKSLSAATLAWRIEEEIGIRVALSRVLDNPTIGKLLKAH